MNEQFECGFCLAVVDAPNYPQFCERCEVVYCTHCASALKTRNGQRPEFCYGCGADSPQITALFKKTENFACVYMERDWFHRNKGYASIGYYYKVVTIATPDGKPMGQLR